MKKNNFLNNKYFFFLTSGIFLFAFFTFITFYYKEPFHLSDSITKKEKTIELAPVNATEAQKYWSGKILSIGAFKSYQQFKFDYNKEDFGTQHLLAHLWGRLLFQNQGITGIGVCDSSFAFGCYHGFMSAAISAEGIKSISEIDKKCVSLYGELGTGCQHGIGHGILEYLGYDSLQVALETCLKTTQVNPLFGCTSGVFMEYNTPLVISANSASFKPRLFNIKESYGPCPFVTQTPFRLSCYFQLGEWWNGILDYKKMGELCGDLHDEMEREVCFEGVGQIAGEANGYTVSSIMDQCNSMPNNSDGMLDCAAGGAWSIFANPAAAAKASDVCNSLPVSLAQSCIKKANLVCNYLNDKNSVEQCYKDNPIKHKL